jgi:ABC-2 type transport system ATP-binding protein
VLKGVELFLERGEVVGLVGANGAGKSTLLACMAGLRRAEGEVQLDGPVGWAGELGPVGRTVEQLLSLVCAVRGVPRETVVGPWPSGRVDQLSAGQRRRLGVALACVGGPAVLLLDEPLTHLDAEGQAWVLEQVEAERARGAGLLIATHHPDRFAFDRVLRIAEGRLCEA